MTVCLLCLNFHPEWKWGWGGNAIEYVLYIAFLCKVGRRGKKTKYVKQITWARWSLADPYQPKYTVNFTASVARPTFEYPTPVVMMSVVNGGGRVFMRFKTLEALYSVFVVPEAYRGRLEDGMKEAEAEGQKIQAHFRLMMKADESAPGGQIVRTDTGEIITQAEDILRGKGE